MRKFMKKWSLKRLFYGARFFSFVSETFFCFCFKETSKTFRDINRLTCFAVGAVTRTAIR